MRLSVAPLHHGTGPRKGRLLAGSGAPALCNTPPLGCLQVKEAFLDSLPRVKAYLQQAKDDCRRLGGCPRGRAGLLDRHFVTGAPSKGAKVPMSNPSLRISFPGRLRGDAIGPSPVASPRRERKVRGEVCGRPRSRQHDYAGKTPAQSLSAGNRAAPCPAAWPAYVLARMQACSSSRKRALHCYTVLGLVVSAPPKAPALTPHPPALPMAAFCVQGSAADVCKRAMVDIHRQLAALRPPRPAALVLQMHDELLLEVESGRLQEVGEHTGLARVVGSLSAGLREMDGAGRLATEGRSIGAMCSVCSCVRDHQAASVPGSLLLMPGRGPSGDHMCTACPRGLRQGRRPFYLPTAPGPAPARTCAGG